jgi:hypothetical protein
VLHLDGTADCINNAAELNEISVARALYDTSVMNRDSWINQITTQCPQPRQRSILVGPGKPAISDYVSSQNRYELPGSKHAKLDRD